MQSERNRTSCLVAGLTWILSGCGQDADPTTGASGPTLPLSLGDYGESGPGGAEDTGVATDPGDTSGPAPTTGAATGDASTGAMTGVDTGVGETTEPGTVSASETTAPPAECGNGVVEGGEECDDVDGNDGDTCTGACKLAYCGDGIVGPGEACDDGNAVDDDLCTNECSAASCGDGTVQGGEECDDGNASDTDACLTSCVAAQCGDGFVRAGVEQCDDGDADDGDACLGTCKLAKCGDGELQVGVEQCDDGNVSAGDGCGATCKLENGVCAPGKFATSFCLQVGTKSQYTRCSSVADGGKTCINPEIKYGNIEGGIPGTHADNDYDEWCAQLGFVGWSGSVTYGLRPCLAPKGRVFGCTSYDEAIFHWCDYEDGYWYNMSPGWHDCPAEEEITAITCL